jgi:hypothetical protein
MELCKLWYHYGVHNIINYSLICREMNHLSKLASKGLGEAGKCVVSARGTKRNFNELIVQNVHSPVPLL